LPSFGFDVGDGSGEPCSASSDQRNGPNKAQVEALCLEQGVPAALLPGFQDQDGIFPGFAGGNPDLESEQADSLTLGVVLSSWFENPWFASLQVAVDWYRIEIEDAIAFLGGEIFVPGCYDPAFNPTFSPQHPFCTFFSRDPATGEMQDVMNLNRNVAGTETSGVDLQVDWRVPLGPGTLGVNALFSWLDYLDVVFVEGSEAQLYAGTVGEFARSSPEWKGSLSLDYQWRDFGLAMNWRYIDSMTRLGLLPSDPETFPVPSYDYVDLIFSYEVAEGLLSGLSLNLGVENLGDEDPPLFPSPIAANTDPSQYDVLGRRYFLNMRYRF
jgi:outer membrane receptor protein involved in Fe transport